MGALDRHVLNSSRTIQWQLWILVACIAAASFTAINRFEWHDDETYHVEQIEWFCNGDMRVSPALVTPPTYHFVIASVARTFGLTTVTGFRLTSLTISLPALVPFYLLCRHLNPCHRALRVLQCLLMPVIFPYFFLVYNDPFSLLFVLLLAFGTVNRAYWAAGLAGAIATLVRQNNILWVAFFFGVGYVQDHGWRISCRDVVATLKKCWSYMATLIAFAVFAFVNKGVAVNQGQYHPSFQLYVENPMGALFLAGIAFLPIHVSNIWRWLSEGRATRWTWAAIGGLATLVYVMFVAFFRADNPYNQAMLPGHFMSQVSISAARTLHWQLLYVAVVVVTILSLYLTKFEQKWQYLLYPAAAIFLASSWLIHARYFIIPFVLYNWFRQESRLVPEWLTLAIMAIFAAAFIATRYAA